MKHTRLKRNTRIVLTEAERQEILHLVNVEKRSIPYTAEKVGRSWGVVHRVVKEVKERAVIEDGIFNVDDYIKSTVTV